jgi:hypothetical protein
VRRAFKIIGWLIGVLVLLIGLAGVIACTFVNSDYVRAEIEHHANAVSGRKTKVGKIAIDWGWTSHVRLDEVAVSNADWGKADDRGQDPFAGDLHRSADSDSHARFRWCQRRGLQGIDRRTNGVPMTMAGLVGLSDSNRRVTVLGSAMATALLVIPAKARIQGPICFAATPGFPASRE